MTSAAFRSARTTGCSGMATDRDIVCKGLASKKLNAGRATARDVMTEGIHCCREDDDLAKAMHHMENARRSAGCR